MDIKNYLIRALLVIFVGYFYLTDVNEKFKKPEFTVIHNDVNFYYAYLPATFIYGDPTFKFADSIPKESSEKIWFLTTEKDQRVSKMTIGTAVMYAPFFTLAHLYAKNSDHKADGYSRPYEWGISLGAIFYVLLGIWLLSGFLKKYFSWSIIILTCLAITLGTNLMHYTTHESGMSHAYSFFLFVVFLHVTEKWHKENMNWKFSLILGLTAGLITLIRPTNIIVLLLPLLYGIHSFKELKSQFINIFRKKMTPTLILVGFLFFIFIQLIFWKVGTGEWLHYSYQDEGFYFLNPHIIDGLFSYRKGWLVYTPIMVFAVVGLFFIAKKADNWKWGIPIFLVLHVYIIFSWWCWWYGGGFGSRPMIETYAFLSIPFAAFFQYIFSHHWWKKIASIIVVYLLIKLNIFQTDQYQISLIHWDGMTKEAYWEIFLKEQFPENYQDLIQEPNYDAAREGKGD